MDRLCPEKHISAIGLMTSAKQRRHSRPRQRRGRATLTVLGHKEDECARLARAPFRVADHEQGRCHSPLHGVGPLCTRWFTPLHRRDIESSTILQKTRPKSGACPRKE